MEWIDKIAYCIGYIVILGMGLSCTALALLLVYGIMSER